MGCSLSWFLKIPEQVVGSQSISLIAVLLILVRLQAIATKDFAMAYRLLSILMRIIEPILIPIEDNLEVIGHRKDAQRLRKVQRYCRGIQREAILDIATQVESEIRFQEIVQREAFLKEECQPTATW